MEEAAAAGQFGHGVPRGTEQQLCPGIGGFPARKADYSCDVVVVRFWPRFGMRA
jgi:hypothetical protein